MISPNEIVKILLYDREKIDHFLKWAFGKDFHGDVMVYEALRYWNKLHKEELEIGGAETVVDSLEKMVNLYNNKFDPSIKKAKT